MYFRVRVLLKSAENSLVFNSEGMAGFPDFRSNETKSGSFISIAYIWPMKIMVAYKYGVVTAMSRRGKGKGSVE